jgi:hypothetical protein
LLRKNLQLIHNIIHSLQPMMPTFFQLMKSKLLIKYKSWTNMFLSSLTARYVGIPLLLLKTLWLLLAHY